MKNLDLTNYMSYVDGNVEAKLPPDDARAQIPPFRYDLYAVTNHFGSLSSGHCELLLVFVSDESADLDARYCIRVFEGRVGILRR